MRRFIDSRGKPRISEAERPPVFEYIQIEATESFLWRRDDYPWERNVWNFHPEYEIHLIRNASGIELVGDYIGQFESGHLCIVGGGLPHDWVTKTSPDEIIPGRDVVLQFDAARIQSAARHLPELAALDPFLELATRGLGFRGHTRRVGGEIVEAIGAAKGLERFALFVSLLDVLSRSTECETLSSSSYSPSLDAETCAVINRVLSYVFENLAQPISLPDVAMIAGMSETAFSRFFKKNSGNSFTDHVRKLRMRRACKLLADSSQSITDICYEIGYSNISNFNRLFLKDRGMTPSAYRGLARQRVPRRVAS